MVDKQTEHFDRAASQPEDEILILQRQELKAFAVAVEALGIPCELREGSLGVSPVLVLAPDPASNPLADHGEVVVYPPQDGIYGYKIERRHMKEQRISAVGGLRRVALDIPKPPLWHDPKRQASDVPGQPSGSRDQREADARFSFADRLFACTAGSAGSGVASIPPDGPDRNYWQIAKYGSDGASQPLTFVPSSIGVHHAGELFRGEVFIGAPPLIRI